MKKKLIALVIAGTMLGTTGVTAFAETQTAIVQNVNAEENSIETYCDNGNQNNGYNNITNTNKPSVEEVGVFKYVWCNIQDAFNNFCDFIKHIMNGQENDNNNGDASNDQENNGDNNQNNTETPGENVDDSTTNKPEDIIPPSQDKPSDNNGNVNNGGSGNNDSSNNGSTNNGSGNNGGSTVKPSTPSQPVTPPSNNNSQQVNDKFMAEVEQAIYQKVNAERAKAGMSALSYNNTMQKYARIKSQDMGDRNYFDHKDPQGNLITVKMQNDGVRYNAWGENIAYIGGVSDPTALANQFMTNWMNSSGHRANILSSNFSSIGVGVYKIGNKVYATQEFYR